MTKSLREGTQDLHVVACARRWLDGLPHALHAALAVGDRAVGLAPGGGGGQHDVGKLRGLGEEDVLHHEVVERAQHLLGVVLVGFGLRGVLTDHVERAQVAPIHRLEHL
jgi:hypothetical protein